MKLLFCNNNITGFLSFRYDIVKHFHEKGSEIVFVYPQSKYKEGYEKPFEGLCRIIRVNVNPNGQNPWRDFKFMLQLRTIYKREKPDVVFNYTIKPNIYSTIAARSLGIKVVSMMAGLGYVFDGDTFIKSCVRLLYKFGLYLSDRVVVLNQDNYNFVCGKYVDPKKLILFRGGEGVNMDMYPYKESNFNRVKFLMIARVLYDKGYQEFVDAAKIVKAQFPDVSFELLGGLSEDSPTGVKKEVLDKDVNSGVLNYLGETKDVPSFVLRNGVVVVVASYYLEGMNRALMEACSMGRPVLTTNMSGCREMVDDGKSGYLFEKKNAQALADACISFLKLSEAEKRKMARASYEKCKSQFDVKYVIKEYDRIVNELICTTAK